MSRPVRIREFVAVPVAERAAVENRSFANMVEVLLLAGLAGREDGNPRQLFERSAVDAVAAGFLPPRSVSPADVAATVDGEKTGAVPAEMAAASPRKKSVGRASSTAVNQDDRIRAADVVPSEEHDVRVRPHMRADRPAVECKERVAAGEMCQVCGREV